MFQKIFKSSEVRLLISAARFLVVAACVFSIGSTSSWAAENCRPVHGRFQLGH